MRAFASTSGILAVSTLLFQHFASACNPLTDGTCPPDKALGTTVNIDFTKGPSSEFAANYNQISYESDGIHLTVGQKGDAPLLVSNWYIMFGRFEIVFQSAPGVGMISSAILQSDDLDEIDWELLGADPTQAQTNYFGRGVTETYDREITVADATATTAFHTYVIDWNQDRLIWSIDGVPLRTQYAANADIDSSGKSEYPQSPMQIKIGPWAGGDPSNAPGTISWAGGPINYGAGPYTMIVKSVSVTDYSTGSEYEYSGTGGTYKDITAVGGTVLGNAAGTGPTSSPPPVVGGAPTTSTTIAPPSSTLVASTPAAVPPTSTSTVVVGSYPTTAATSSIVDTHTGWPWVPSSTTGGSTPAVTSTTLTMAYSSGSASSHTQLSSSASPLPSSSAGASSSASSFSAPVAPYSSSAPVAPHSSAASAAPSSTSGVAGTSPETSVAPVTTTAAGHTTVTPTTAASTFAQSEAASSAASSTPTVYTGGAGRMAITKLGAAACVAAGLIFIV